MLPEYLVGYNFIIKEKRGEEENHLPCSSSISSLTPPVCQVGEILTPYGSSGPVMALWKIYFRSQFNEGLSLWSATFSPKLLCREHVLGVINVDITGAGCRPHVSTIVLLSWDMAHTTIGWFCCWASWIGFAVRQACLALMLSNLLGFMSQASPHYSRILPLLSWVINKQRFLLSLKM